MNAGELRAKLPGRTIVSLEVRSEDINGTCPAKADESGFLSITLQLDDGTAVYLGAYGCCCYGLEAVEAK